MIFIDADVLVYRIGYGCKDWEFVDTIDALDLLIKKIVDKFEIDYQLVLSNTKPTFRHQIAKTLPYKGNRKAEKPVFYNELRQYLLDQWNAVMSEEGFEADDHIGMNVDRKKDFICTIDKDLFMIPARGHYNFVKDELVKIKRPSYYFWYQMLVGDTADNIKGLNRIGAKTAEKILKGLKTSEMREMVIAHYKNEFLDTWRQRFNENGRLLWIKRSPDKEFYHYL